LPPTEPKRPRPRGTREPRDERAPWVSSTQMTPVDPDEVAPRDPVDSRPGEAAVRAGDDANVRRRQGSAPPVEPVRSMARVLSEPPLPALVAGPARDPDRREHGPARAHRARLHRGGSPASAPGRVSLSCPHPEARSSLVVLSPVPGANECGAAHPCPTYCPTLPVMALISSDGRSWTPNCGPDPGLPADGAALPCWPRDRQGLSKPPPNGRSRPIRRAAARPSSGSTSRRMGAISSSSG
jgi:hypothetical protein